MSPWLPKRVRIALHRDRAALVCLGHGRRPAVLASAVVHSPRPDDWRSLLASLTETLEQASWRRSRLEFVLSHHWCRLSLIPGGISLRNRREEERFVRMRLIQDNGELPEHWEVALAENSPTNARIACAADGEFIRAIDAVANQSKCRVTSVQPLFAASYNARRRHIGSRHTWFVTVEPERCCIARIEGGLWRSVRLRRLFADPAAEVAALLDQERLLADGGELPREVFVCAPELPGFRLVAGSLWIAAVSPENEQRRLPSQGDAAFAMALEDLA